MNAVFATSKRQSCSRRLAVLLGCLLTGANFAACDAGPGTDAGIDASASVAGQATPRVAKLKISGMSCHGCASGIEKSLTELPGVETAEVSRDDKIARVTLSADAKIGEAELRAAVNDRGYKVTGCTWES